MLWRIEPFNNYLSNLLSLPKTSEVPDFIFIEVCKINLKRGNKLNRVFFILTTCAEARTE